MTLFAKTGSADMPAASERDTRGFGAAGGASLALHGGVAALLVGMAWLGLRDSIPEAMPESFRLVPSGTGASPDAASMAGAGDPADAEMASAPELLFTAPPSVPSWTPPTPARGAESAPERSPRPLANTAPASAPARDTRPIRYEEHLRRQGTTPNASGPRSGSTETAAASGPVARIDMDKVRGEPGSGSSPRPQADGATGTAMEAYFGDLVVRLRDSHKLPKGVDGQLKTEVQFTLAANGAASDVRVLHSSGSKEFDQSVIDAFGRLKMPARPDGKTDVQRLTFRIVE